MYGGNAHLPESFKLVLSQPNADALGTVWYVAEKDGEIYTTIPGDHGSFFCFRRTEFFKADEIRAVASLSGRMNEMKTRELAGAIAARITTSKEVVREFDDLKCMFISDTKKASLEKFVVRCMAVSNQLK